MGRMTEKDASGRWQVKGIPWEKLQAGQVITEEASQILYGCLWRLKDYEDSGLNPEQVTNLQYGAENMAAQVCDSLCRYREESTVQEELDEVCRGCPVNAVMGRIFGMRMRRRMYGEETRRDNN